MTDSKPVLTDGGVEKLHPAEQWSEDLYQRLTDKYGIPGRATSVIGMGNDNHVYVTADPFSMVDLRLALQNEGYQPREDGDFMFKIVPDFERQEDSDE